VEILEWGTELMPNGQLVGRIGRGVPIAHSWLSPLFERRQTST